MICSPQARPATGWKHTQWKGTLVGQFYISSFCNFFFPFSVSSPELQLVQHRERGGQSGKQGLTGQTELLAQKSSPAPSPIVSHSLAFQIPWARARPSDTTSWRKKNIQQAPSRLPSSQPILTKPMSGEGKIILQGEWVGIETQQWIFPKNHCQIFFSLTA